MSRNDYIWLKTVVPKHVVVFVFVQALTSCIFVSDNLKKNDKEMQALLKRVWPKLTKNTLDKIMPKPPRNASECFVEWKYFKKVKAFSGI